MTTLRYRPATSSDALTCVALRAQTRENAFSAATLASLGITAASWGRDIETGRLAGQVCSVEGEMIAYCFGDRPTGEVVVLVVLPPYENRGIGAMLLSKVVTELRSLGHQRLYLGCSSDASHRSYGFYRHLGWVSTGAQDAHGDEVLELLAPSSAAG